MGLFGRKTKGGRHALGAAVTSIPSGPLPLAAPLPPAAPASAVAPPPSGGSPAVSGQPVEPSPGTAGPPAQPAVPPPAEGDLMTSIAVLIATGEAWSTDGLVATHERHAPPVPQPAPGTGPVPVAHESSGVTAVRAPEVPAAPVAPSAVPAPRPSSPAVPAPTPAATASRGTARSSLEAALAELLPIQPDALVVGTATAPQAAPAVASGDDPAAAVLPPAPAPIARRVQLGFRDGTSTTLDPGSSQALALEEIAQSLTRRD